MSNILRFHPRADTTDQNRESDVNVSTLSKFSDKKWRYHDEITDPSAPLSSKEFTWDWQLPNGDSFLNEKYFSMLLALKQLSVLLVREGVLKPTTLISVISLWRVFVRFLVSRPHPVYRFRDVLPSDIKEFFDHAASRPGKGGKGKLSTSSLANYYRCINFLFEARDHITDGLTTKPSGDKSAKAAANHNRSPDRRTKFIPDEAASVLLKKCIRYVEGYAPMLFDCWKKLQKMKKGSKFKSASPETRYRMALELFATYTPPRPVPADYSLAQVLDSIHSLERELIRLRTACFIIIAFSTGMRLGEIASIKRGCLSTEETRNHGTFYWITATLRKTSKLRNGSVRKWMCGRLAADAVKTLEQLSIVLGASKDTPYLFTTLNQVAGVKPNSRGAFKIVYKAAIRPDLKSFCEDMGVGVHIHSHMFRRTFARNIVRFSSTSLLALKEHFKHWSLYMTDWYVGLDPDLVGELEAERQILSMELMDKICTGKVGGPGGRRWTAELEKRISDGRLPKTFRGKAGSGFRKTLIEDVHESGLMVVPCGDITHCVFRKDFALCTDGETPVTSQCNSYSCRNSFITEEHLPAHELKLSEYQSRYDEFPEARRQSPEGKAYLRKIKEVKFAIKQFKETSGL